MSYDDSRFEVEELANFIKACGAPVSILIDVENVNGAKGYRYISGFKCSSDILSIQYRNQPSIVKTTSGIAYQAT
jgi:hypothetical protein